VRLQPVTAGSELLELSVWSDGDKLLSVVFADVQDRRGHRILSIRDQNNFKPAFRQKRFMTLAHIFLIHRYRVAWVHYLSPNEDNLRQARRMEDLGIFTQVKAEAGLIIVAEVNTGRVDELLDASRAALSQLMQKQAAARG
jgi:isocitrate lyase